MTLDQLAEFDGNLVMASQRQGGLGADFGRVESQLLEPRRGFDREVRLDRPECAASPQPESLTQGGLGSPRVVGQITLTSVNQPFERDSIDQSGLDVEQVAVRPEDEESRNGPTPAIWFQGLAQSRH